MTAPAATQRPAWLWTLSGPEDLRSCLEEYSEYELAQGSPASSDDTIDRERVDRQYRIWSQNKTIDVFMRVLKQHDHQAADLLKGYYCFGLWGEFRGWYKVAQAMLKWNLPPCSASVRCRRAGDDRIDIPKCASVVCVARYAEFQERVDVAILALYDAYLGRLQ